MQYKIINSQSAEESELQTKKSKQSLTNGVAIPFDEANELLAVDWTLDNIKLVASFYNKIGAEGNFIFTGNLNNDIEMDYFDMIRRIMEAFVVNRPDDPAFPSSVLIRILSNSGNKCFLGCLLSFLPEDFSRLNSGEVFLPEIFQAIMEVAGRRYSSLS